MADNNKKERPKIKQKLPKKEFKDQTNLISKQDKKKPIENIPLEEAYVLATRGIIVFPSTYVKVDVGRKRSLDTIYKAVNGVDTNNKQTGQIIIVSQINPVQDNPSEESLFTIGTLVDFRIEKTAEDQSITLICKGIKKVKIVNYINEDQCYKAKYYEVEIPYVLSQTVQDNIQDLLEKFKWKLMANPLYLEMDIAKLNMDQKNKLVYWIPYAVQMHFLKQQKILEETSFEDQVNKIIFNCADDKYLEKLDEQIAEKVTKNLNRQQKEFYLRERLKTIKEELGDITSKEDDTEAIREKIRKNPYPDHIKKRLTSELNRLETLSNSNEYSISKSYIDWLLDLPYWQEDPEKKDLSDVEKALDEGHYGLEKAKERIVEYLAVRMHSSEAKGSIICLVGPPGVGKTSLAQSIAKALNKKFVKMALGGVHDESELRGHRKTYIGSMPGRIIKGMSKVGVINPVFLLDEIDKIASSHKGDPASALLEVLDPEQNKTFSDNYIEEDYDLSKVLFIATANYEENIPEALADRLEIIRLSSYTENEKLWIAKNYLIKKTITEFAINKDELTFTDDGLSYIIKRYTREAGVRELERLIRQIARKFLVQKQKGQIEKNVIDKEQVKFYLKKEIYDYTQKDKESIPGIVNGMAYTTAGGDLLPIEATYSKGKGNVSITGNLKETMKESVNVALGYVKANSEKFGIDPNIFSEIDFHIHVPSGGIPKDGPSAGIALTTAILSALKNKKIPTNVAMTGEMTLRGRVLIIGGVKEKTISAFRGGANDIFMPKEDERYLDDVPQEIKDKIKITLVETYDDVYNRLFN